METGPWVTSTEYNPQGWAVAVVGFTGYIEYAGHFYVLEMF